MAKKQRVIQRLKPAPYTLQDLKSCVNNPSFSKVTSVPIGAGNEIDLYSTPDIPQNKRGFKYSPCRPNPLFKSLKYSTSDCEPYNVSWSFFDRSNDALINSEMNIASVVKSHGWRSVRGNTGIREGRWYIEYKITENSDASHVRIGIARREASLEAPVGFDGYGYGIRDIGCQGVHLSRRIDLGGERDLKKGDIVGLLVDLPCFENQQNVGKIHDYYTQGPIRDMIPIKYKNGLFFEQYEYTSSNEMNHLLNPITVFGEQAVPDKERFKPVEINGSSLKVFVNGKQLSHQWNNLLAFLPPSSEQREQMKAHPNKPTPDDGDLGYYPMVSCFKGGSVELNTSSRPWIAPSETEHYKMYGQRYQERVIEEYVWDIVDEIVNEWLDNKELTLA